MTIGGEQGKYLALVDSGADINAINYETWTSLENKPELETTKLKMTTFVGDKKGALGYCSLDLYIDETNVRHRFYVMKPGRMTAPILLGTPWQRVYNSAINWKEDGIDFVVNNKKMFEPFIPKECYTDETDSKDDTSDNESPPVVETVEASPISKNTNPLANQNKPTMQRIVQGNQGHTTIWIPKKLKEAQEGSFEIWVPKCLATSITQKQQPKRITKTKSTGQSWEHKPEIFKQDRKTRPYSTAKIAARRIHRSTLQAQGYYEGQTCLWLPKQLPYGQAQLSSTPQPKTSKAKPKKEWIPK